MSNKDYSENYYQTIEMYKSIHTKGTPKLPPENTFAGHSLKKWIVHIKKIISSSSSESIIDFGCGKAHYYCIPINFKEKKFKNLQDYWQIKKIFLYDPGVEIYSQYPPNKADGVLCTDVIEHIPEPDVIKFIDNLFKLSNKFIFCVIATNPASKFFKDGRNIHLSIKPKEEWDNIFLTFKKKYPEINQHIYFNHN